MTKKLHLVSLGCPKNLVDSEVALGRLLSTGYQLTDTPEEADLLVLNTCGFIQPAVEESVDEILRLLEYKEENPSIQIAVIGCLVQRYGKDLVEEFPEVDLFIGTDGFQNIDTLLQQVEKEPTPHLVRRPSSYIMENKTLRQRSTPFFRAYLKITEGCNNRCSYCMIPAIRGDLRSRTIEDLVAEARALEAQGVRELSLISQDLTAYGKDWQNTLDLTDLLKALLAKTTIPWLRLLYLYPSTVTLKMLELMAEESRILPYLDLPIQHVSDTVLKKMNRHYTKNDLDNIIPAIRRTLPHTAIRTTLMVGFPGETDNDVEQLIEVLQRWQLDHVGVFTYADEEGSPAAAFSDKIEESVKKNRYKQVMEIQAAISAAKQNEYIGRIEEVLVEGISRESELLLEGRTRFQAPDIDGVVYITEGTASPGEIVPVKISEAHTYDLAGSIVNPQAAK